MYRNAVSRVQVSQYIFLHITRISDFDTCLKGPVYMGLFNAKVSIWLHLCEEEDVHWNRVMLYKVCTFITKRKLKLGA